MALLVCLSRIENMNEINVRFIKEQGENDEGDGEDRENEPGKCPRGSP